MSRDLNVSFMMFRFPFMLLSFLFIKAAPKMPAVEFIYICTESLNLYSRFVENALGDKLLQICGKTKNFRAICINFPWKNRFNVITVLVFVCLENCKAEISKPLGLPLRAIYSKSSFPRTCFSVGHVYIQTLMKENAH